MVLADQQYHHRLDPPRSHGQSPRTCRILGVEAQDHAVRVAMAARIPWVSVGSVSGWKRHVSVTHRQIKITRTVHEDIPALEGRILSDTAGRPHGGRAFAGM